MKFNLFIFTLLLVTGCAPYGPEELDRLIKEDPQFRQMIQFRDIIHAEARLIKDDLLGRKKAMDAQIEKLRSEYDGYAKAQNVKIEKFEMTIAANRNALKREMDTASAAIAAKEKELEGYQKTLADVQHVLKESKGITLSVQERQKWEERVLMLSEKIRPLSEEIQNLKIQNKLRKRKISFLK
ncbi:MAG: hypothetical protein HY592_01735 [Candidatus Omnitrophica bacterium]|nr:hypothetical protein [Candidatus Omnitrophota bacterium]